MSYWKELCNLCDDVTLAMGEIHYVVYDRNEFKVVDKTYFDTDKKIYYESKPTIFSDNAEFLRTVQRGIEEPRGKNIKGSKFDIKSVIRWVGADNYRRWLREVSEYFKTERDTDESEGVYV